MFLASCDFSDKVFCFLHVWANFTMLEPGVGLGIGVCCLTLDNSPPGIYIHSLALGSVAKMDGRLRWKVLDDICGWIMCKKKRKKENTLTLMYLYSCLCSRGDQILEVDSVSLRHVALSEAYAILSECGPGPVSLIISRHPNPKVRGPQLLINNSDLFSFTVFLFRNHMQHLQSQNKKSWAFTKISFFVVVLIFVWL